MRAKHRKLLGMLGALAVPIALVVGLYTDSGDLFKGYLTFDDPNTNQEISRAEQTTVSGYLNAAITGGVELDESDKLVVKDGFFKQYFTGELPVDSPAFTSEDCTATEDFSRGNLGNQYNSLVSLLENRIDDTKIEEFVNIKAFYNDSLQANQQLLTADGLRSDTADNSGFVSYEDVQKAILLNFMAYQTSECKSIGTYHVDGDTSKSKISVMDLEEKLFEYSNQFKERQVAKHSLFGLNSVVSSNHFISFTSEEEKTDFDTELTSNYLSLRSEEQDTEFARVENQFNQMNITEDESTSIYDAFLVAFDEGGEGFNAYGRLLSEINNINTKIDDGDFSDYYDEAVYDSLENTTVELGNEWFPPGGSNFVSHINDLITDFNGAYESINLNIITEALIGASINTFSAADWQVISDSFVPYINKTDQEIAALLTTDAIPTVDLQTKYRAVQDFLSSDAAEALADKYFEYLLHFHIHLAKSLDSFEFNDYSLIRSKLNIVSTLANIISLYLEQGTQTILADGDAVNAEAAFTFISAVNPKIVTFSKDLIDVVTDGTRSTSEYFNDSIVTVGEGFIDPSSNAIDTFRDNYTTLYEAMKLLSDNTTRIGFTNYYYGPTIGIYNDLKEIIESIKIKTSIKFDTAFSQESLIDMRAGSLANGGFPAELLLISDMQNATVTGALIQLEPIAENGVAPEVNREIITSLIKEQADLLLLESTIDASDSAKFKVLHVIDTENFTGSTHSLDLSALNSDALNFRGDTDLADQINPNFSQILLVKIGNTGEGQEHNFIEGSEQNILEDKYLVYIFKDNITTTAELSQIANLTTRPTEDEFTVGEPFSIISTVDDSLNLPSSSVENSVNFALVAENADCDASDQILREFPAEITETGTGTIIVNNYTLDEAIEAGTYKLCISIYNDVYQPAQSTITFVEADEAEAGTEGEEEEGATEEESTDEVVIESEISATAQNLILELSGEELSDDPSDYKLVTPEGVIAIRSASALEQDDTRTLLSFGEVKPGVYQIAYKDDVQSGLITIDQHKVLNTNIGVSNPLIRFDCLSDHTYTATLTNTVDNSQVQYTDIECKENVGEFKVTTALDKGVRYEVSIDTFDDQGLKYENLFEEYRFTTSDIFLLSKEQVSVMDFTCGKQIPESKDANGIPIPGKRNVVVKGTTTNCAVTNPYPKAGISTGFMVKIGENTSQASAVQLQAIQGGFAATNIPVPEDASDYNIYVLVPSGDTNEFVKTSSYVTPYNSNNQSNTDRAEGDVEDLVEVVMPNTVEIGEKVDLEIDIPENLDVHMMVVRYQGNEDDSETNDFSGPIFIYCQEDITDHFEKSRDRRKIDRICDDFYEDDILEGPDTVEIEGFDTSRLGAEGEYDIVVDLFVDESTLPAEALSKADSQTAYAQSISIKQIRITIEEAFEAEDRQLGGSRAFIDGRTVLASGVNFSYPQMSMAYPAKTQQCQTIFRDLNSSHQICQDIMYLYNIKPAPLYTGVRMGNNVVSGVNQPAVRAHLFSFIYRVLKNYGKVANYGVNYQELYKYQDARQYLKDPSQQWWLTPLATLSSIGFVQGDANYNVNPFARVTQAEAAKLIGMATGLIPTDLQPKNPWYTDIIGIYAARQMNLNPMAPATMGDLIVILSRSLQMMRNPGYHSVVNQYY